MVDEVLGIGTELVVEQVDVQVRDPCQVMGAMVRQPSGYAGAMPQMSVMGR